MIIDCHTHILPEIDDGARDLDTSIKMLEEEKKQGVDKIIATPHFYAERDWIDKFTERRKNAYERILAYEKSDFIKEGIEIRLGAEVAYFNGISRAEEIETLCIEESKTILIEMPFRKWDKRILEEIQDLATERKLTVVLAHIERFIEYKENLAMLDELQKIPVYLQMNAECILEEGIFKKKKVNKLTDMFESGRVSLMGSDCHNMESRKPNIEAARKKLSESCLSRIDKISEEIFGF